MQGSDESGAAGRCSVQGLDKQGKTCFPVVGSELRAEFCLTPRPTAPQRHGTSGTRHQAKTLRREEKRFRMEPPLASVGRPSPRFVSSAARASSSPAAPRSSARVRRPLSEKPAANPLIRFLSGTDHARQRQAHRGTAIASLVGSGSLLGLCLTPSSFTAGAIHGSFLPRYSCNRVPSPRRAIAHACAAPPVGSARPGGAARSFVCRGRPAACSKPMEGRGLPAVSNSRRESPDNRIVAETINARDEQQKKSPKREKIFLATTKDRGCHIHPGLTGLSIFGRAKQKPLIFFSRQIRPSRR